MALVRRARRSLLVPFEELRFEVGDALLREATVQPGELGDLPQGECRLVLREAPQEDDAAVRKHLSGAADYGMIDPDGSMNRTTQDIVQASVELDGDDFRLVHPVG